MKINLLVIILIPTVLLLNSCGEEKTKVQSGETEKADKEVLHSESTYVSQSGLTEDKLELQIPDVIGTWVGTFDGRPTTLVIDKQDSIAFSGRITINYRNPINQEVSGSINPDDLSFSMKDLLHSRYQGNYSGNISEDGNTLSGTFIMTVDKSKFSFNLNRK